MMCSMATYPSTPTTTVRLQSLHEPQRHGSTFLDTNWDCINRLQSWIDVSQANPNCSCTFMQIQHHGFEFIHSSFVSCMPGIFMRSWRSTGSPSSRAQQKVHCMLLLLKCRPASFNKFTTVIFNLSTCGQGAPCKRAKK